tara:strand:- start:962 stop:2197 length:1236 start_codon:yes stop_codon:yes gene_type:complete
MSDLLKEAIADARAVRETALQNAKMALEEAFTPQLKSMLSAKLREDDDEFEDDELAAQDEIPGEEDPEAMMAQDEIPGEEDPEAMMAQDEVPGEEDPEAMMAQDEVPGEEDPEAVAAGYHEDDEIPGDEEEVYDEEVEIAAKALKNLNPKQIAALMKSGDLRIEQDDAYDETNPPDKDGLAEEDDDEEPEALDLESIIRELEDEMDDEEDKVEEQDDAYDETNPPDKDGLAEDNIFEIDGSLFEEDEEDEDEEEVEEQTDSSNVGSGDNVVNVADSSDEEDPGQGKLSAEGVRAKLKEYVRAVRFLKNKLHEVNILNAKLLFTNKLFKEFVLDNAQKMRVVETFDRSQTTREIKLVYTTLAQQFGDRKPTRRKNIRESASSRSGSTRPIRKVITEENQVADRFKKLAGLIK